MPRAAPESKRRDLITVSAAFIDLALSGNASSGGADV